MKTDDLQRDVTITEVDLPSLSDDEIVRLNTFTNALRAETDPDDPPTPVSMTAAAARAIPPVIWLREFWARASDGALVATAETSYMRTEENRHVLDAVISVLPDRRGRGLARELLRRVLDTAEAEGRTTIIGSSTDRVPASIAFAERVGAELALRQHVNRLLLADLDPALVQGWVDDGPRRAPGYSLLAFDGRYPDEWLEQIAAVGNLLNDAPRDDLDVEDFVNTPEHERQYEEMLAARGTERWALFVLHEDSGRLVGYSEVGWNPAQPDTVFQWGTAVDPAHRGHALGKWLKGAMLARILRDRPGVVDVRTGNADSNDAMLGINQALGFAPYRAYLTWQLRTERARAYLDARR